MSNNLMQNITDQLKNLNIPEDQITNIQNQVSSQLGNFDMKNLDPKNMSIEMIQTSLSGILSQNGIKSDVVNTIVQNVLKDGFQPSDITDQLGNVSNASIFDKIKGMFGGLFK